MRWREPREGERRIRTFFAWFPTWIRHGRYTVWLETVTVEQEFDDWWDCWMTVREVPLNSSLVTRHSSLPR